MRHSLLIIAFISIASAPVDSQHAPPNPIDAVQPIDALQFRPFALVIDPHGAPLAGYQVEVVDSTGQARIVGVEGGTVSFAEPPHYDPAALRDSERIILAAFTLDESVPTQATHVATLHFSQPAGTSSEFTVRLVTAIDSNGQEIDATATLTVQGDQR